MAAASTTLMVGIDESSKAYIAKAAALRKISISDCVRSITVTQAEREVRAAEHLVIALMRGE